MRLAIVIRGLALLAPLHALRAQDWVAILRYESAQLIPLRLGPARMPLVEVEVAGVRSWLLFDTGNMVGLSLAERELTRRPLTADSTWTQVASDGRALGTLRRFRPASVVAFGRDLGDRAIFEMAGSDVDGLIGPDLLPANRFTLDYNARVIALSQTTAGPAPVGFVEVPLIRSARFPRLILAYCFIAGRRVLTEFDTGKSRTVIAPQLARALRLVSDQNGVRIDSLLLGGHSFAIASAKQLSLAAIAPELPAPIELSVGSDVLSQVLLTVDYGRGQLMLRFRPPR